MATGTNFKEIKKFEHELEQCTKCGYCTFWCPVYQEERVESSLARGKNQLIRALVSGELDYTKEFGERIDKCLLCMTCTVNCPAKTQIASVVIAARADMARVKGINFPYNLIYRWLIPHRMLFGNTVKFASRFQTALMPKTEGKLRHLPFFLAALGEGRQIPSIAPKFLRQLVPVINRPPPDVETKKRVGYFVGCMTDFVFPEIGIKIINFLVRNGVEVIVPREQGCCGAPIFLGAGDFDTGRKIADNNIRAFKDLDCIITDCATCASAMIDYPKFLSDTPERERTYLAYASKVQDITKFLVDVLRLPASAYKPSEKAKGLKVTWHAPCHLNRQLGVKSQPKQILNSIPEIKFVEMPDEERCCGMAGTFSLHYYDLSKKIADKKVEAIRASGADIVATACPGCEVQLLDNLARHKMPQKVVHIMELIE